MKRFTSFTLVMLLLMIGIVGCGSDNGKDNLQFLSRVDIQLVNADGTYSDVQMITKQESLNKLREAFEAIQWEENVYPDMARREDVKATLFLQLDKNMPETLVEYLIWYNQESQKAEIINTTEHAYGKLDVENTKLLKDALQVKQLLK